MIHALSLFTGGGGLDLGVGLALGGNLRSVCMVERNAFAVSHLVQLMEAAPFTRALSGMTWKPSTQDLIVDSWTASLARRRVSPTASLVNAVDKLMTDGFGRKSLELLGSQNQTSCFSKTCLGWSLMDSCRSQKTLSDWVSILRSASLARRNAARHTRGNGSLSSEFGTYPTPQAFDANDCQKGPEAKSYDANRRSMGGNGGPSKNLREVFNAMWPTLTNSMATVQDMEQARYSGGDPRRPKYKDAWPKAMANDATDCWPTRTVDGNYNADGLTPTSGNGLSTVAVKHWSTPNSANSAQGTTQPSPSHLKGTHGSNLATDSALWPTANASDHKGSTKKGQRRGQLSEATEQLWSTPTTSDTNGPGDHGEGAPDLRTQVSRCSRPDPETAQPGSESSPSGPNSPRPSTSPRLNPAFVAWLMSWPLIGVGIFGCSETEWFRSARRWHCCHFGALLDLVKGSSR